MHASRLAPLLLLASSSSVVLAAPHQLAASNSTDRLVLPYNSSLPLNVTDTAGGDAPNAPLTAYITDTVIAQFWIANFLENLEASFFAAGAENLSEWGTEGYPAGTLEVVRKVAAVRPPPPSTASSATLLSASIHSEILTQAPRQQEQVHVTTITSILSAYNHLPLQPCRYQFPVTSTSEFLSLAQTITAVGIGAILDIAATLAEQAPLLLPSLTSLVTVEARHDAFFRSAAANLVPNPAPFDTRISAVWALNLAWPFVVPGSCPTPLEFPFFAPLNIGVAAPGSVGRRRCVNASADDATSSSSASSTSTALASANTTPTDPPPAPRMTFTLPLPFQPYLNLAASSVLYVAWVNQANVPVYTEATVTDGTVETAVPPGLAGVAFAALTGQNQAWNVTALTNATLAGPVVVGVS